MTNSKILYVNRDLIAIQLQNNEYLKELVEKWIQFPSFIHHSVDQFVE